MLIGQVATESTPDGQIRFLDDNPQDEDIPLITIRPAGGGPTIRTSSPQEEGLITASAADGCQPGALRTR